MTVTMEAGNKWEKVATRVKVWEASAAGHLQMLNPPINPSCWCTFACHPLKQWWTPPSTASPVIGQVGGQQPGLPLSWKMHTSTHALVCAVNFQTLSKWKIHVSSYPRKKGHSRNSGKRLMALTFLGESNRVAEKMYKQVSPPHLRWLH